MLNVSNKLIPDEEFQTAVPSNDGLLTLRSTNTESPSNNDLLDIFGLNTLTSIIPSLPHENLPPDSNLIPLTIPVESLPISLVTQDFTNLDSSELIVPTPCVSPESIPASFTTPCYTNLDSIDLITPTTPIAAIPILSYTQGTCFNSLQDTILITDKDELSVYLCDVLIRFDSAPAYYQKEDYIALLGVLTRSLIYLYDQDALHTNPSSRWTFKNELMIGVINGTNRIFTTTEMFVHGSLVVYVNGLKIRNYTIDSNFQITLDEAPSNIGMLDIVEATYVAI